MFRKTLSLAAMVTVSIAIAGCNNQKIDQQTQPNLTTPGAIVYKADLIDALWNPGEDTSIDAECLVGSSFQIFPEASFTIMRNAEPTKEHPAGALIVSNIEIYFDDYESDGRGASCGQGSLSYMIAVSEDDPIDIVSSTELLARHSVANIARDTATEYPGCAVSAYFEKTGVEVCDGDQDVDDDDEAQDEDQDDEGQYGDDDQDQDQDQFDGQDGDDDQEGEDEGDDDGNDVVIVPGTLQPFQSQAGFKAVYVDKPVKCGSEEIRSIRLVIDDFNCRLQNAEPRRPGEVSGPGGMEADDQDDGDDGNAGEVDYGELI